jgi:AcrR family transcriptional regulator
VTRAAVARTPVRPAGGVKRGHNRLAQLLDEAAHVFAQRGFAAASVREIVGPVGMLPGSLYYHFETKEELLVAVYREGVQRIGARVDAAIDTGHGPWDRLQAACVAHLSALLDHTDYSQVVIRIRPGDAPGAASTLGTLRDAYEDRFRALIEALPLPGGVDRRDVRLMLLGALNWSQTWFRADGPCTPAQTAVRFVQILQRTLLSEPAQDAAAAPPSPPRSAP